MASLVPDLPLWAWNLVIAMQRHEELHGSADTCLSGVINAVPAEVRTQAEAISSYVQKASGHQVADQATATFGELIGSFFDGSGEKQPAAEGAP
jgi:hypothetical protein